MKDIYIPSRGQRIPMPGNQPDWPLEGQPIDPLDRYQRRLVRDKDLILKPVVELPKGDKK